MQFRGLIPDHKEKRPWSMTYDEIKERMGQKHSWQSILVLDRGATRVVRNRGYFSLDYWNYKSIMRWYPDGRIIVDLGINKVNNMRSSWRNAVKPANSTGLSLPWSVISRINRYLPYKWHFYSFRYHIMVSNSVNTEADGFECPRCLTFDKTGSLVHGKLGPSQATLHAHYYNEYKNRSRTRRRGQYWVRRARNLYLNRCDKRYPHCDRLKLWPRPVEPRKFECGCELYRKNIKFRYSAQDILKERNSTVRTCMIKIYGTAKFFEDVGARIIAKAREYQLLRMEFGKARTNRELTPTEQRQLILHALKMVCPSTGQIYVTLVPNNITGVEQALNWKYQTQRYFDTVGQET